MPTFDEELAALDSGGPSFDDELAALDAVEATGPEPEVQMGSSPSGIQFSAKPSEVAAWNAGPDTSPAPPPDMDFSAEPMAVPQRGGLPGLGDRLFRGNAQRSYDNIASGVGKSGVTYEQPSVAETYGGAVMGPVVGGALAGGIRGARTSEADTLSGIASDAGQGALYGGLGGVVGKVAGGGSKIFGKAADWAGDKWSALANSPGVKTAAQVAMATSGGTIGAGIGSQLDVPGGTAAGSFLGTAAGGYLGGRGVPMAMKALAGASRGVGAAAGAAGTIPGQALAGALAGDQIREQHSVDTAASAGKGNLLGEAALDSLQNNPQVLGDYQAEFAKAASSPDPGAVNTLITRLSSKDEKFRTGPLVELQKMTASY